MLNHQSATPSNRTCKNQLLKMFICLAIALVVSGLASAQTPEVEPNDTPDTAQNIDNQFNQNANPDIGDTSSNTATTIPHQTLLGSGTGPGNKDVYQFQVNKAGTGIFDIDYGQLPFEPERLGIAEQLDGTIWIKNKLDFFFLDENKRPQWGFKATGTSRLHNVLAVHPVSGLFYSINQNQNTLVTIDPVSGNAVALGIIGVNDITALAFDENNNLFAVTGSDDRISRLYQLNPTTGAMIAEIGDTGEVGIKGLAFHPQSGVLYASKGDDSPSYQPTLAANSSGMLYSLSDDDGFEEPAALYRIDPVLGTNERVGVVGAPGIRSIAFDSSDNLYGVSGQGPMAIYRLDPNSGAVLQNLGLVPLLNVQGIDFHPASGLLYTFARGGDYALDSKLAANSSGVLYGIIGGDTRSVLVTVDPLNGDVHLMGNIPLGYVHSLAFNASDQLFVLAPMPDSDEDGLYQINPADGSVVSAIGNTGYEGLNGLAFEPVDDDLYSTLETRFDVYFNSNNMASDTLGNFYTVDEDGVLYRYHPAQIVNATLVATRLGSSGISDITALAFDDTDQLFAVAGGEQSVNTLYQLDKSNGALLATIGSTGVSGMNGLDFHPTSKVLYGHSSALKFEPRANLATDSHDITYTIDGHARLMKFDPADGFMEVVALVADQEYSALAFDGSDQLYVVTRQYDPALGDYISFLRKMDSTTGNLTETVGEIGYPYVSGISFHPGTGVLYGHVTDPSRLITISTTTGQGTLVGNTGLIDYVSDIAFQNSANELFGIVSGINKIATFDPDTGSATYLPSSFGTNVAYGGIASYGPGIIAKSDSELYGVDTDSGEGTLLDYLRLPGLLYTVNTTTGATTPVAATDAPSTILDISFDTNTNLLYGWADEVQDLVSINIVTGEVLIIGEANTFSYDNGLAFSRSDNSLLMRSNSNFYSVVVGTGTISNIATIGSQSPQLVSLDTNNATVSIIGPTLNPNMNTQIGRFSDLTFDSNAVGGNPDYRTLYGYHEHDGDLYSIDLNTGNATPLGSSGLCCQAGITHDGTNLVLIQGGQSFYTVNQTTGLATSDFTINATPANSESIFTIDTGTLAVTELGSTGISEILDLTFNDAGVLFAWSPQFEEGLHTISTVDGSASLLGPSNIDNNTEGGIAFDSSSGELIFQSFRDLYELNTSNGNATFVGKVARLPGGLYNINPTNADTIRVGQSLGRDDKVPDITFDHQGILLGIEADDWKSLVEFNLQTGAAATHWGFFPTDAGLTFTSDGTFWVKDDDDGLFTVDINNGQATFAAQIPDYDQDHGLAADSNDVLFTFDNDEDDGAPLYRMDRTTGVTALVGPTGLDLQAIAFDASDTLFAVSGDNEDSSLLYVLDVNDGSASLIGDTGQASIHAMDFHPASGVLYAHRSSDGALITLDPANGSLLSVIGQTGIQYMDDFAFSPDGRLFAYSDDDPLEVDDGPYTESFFEIDIATGAATPLGRFGHFPSRLTLLDTDGTTPLAGNAGALFSYGQFGSNPDADDSVWSDDAYIQYEFTTPGTYYLQVESADYPFVTVGGTYSLHFSVPGGHSQMVFSDGFENP